MTIEDTINKKDEKSSDTSMNEDSIIDANGRNKKNIKNAGNVNDIQSDNESSSEKNNKNNKIKQLAEKKPVRLLLAIVIVAAVYWGAMYWKKSQEYVFIEKAQITAPNIELGPGNTGILKKVYVSDGDAVKANQLVAIIGDEYIRTQISGIVIGANNSPGQIFSRGQWIVKMIDPKEIRVEGRVEEDKGLNDIHEGQLAVFTVDAFGNQEFNGEVESVSETSREGDVVFSISDKREEKEFNVKVRFDNSTYRQLRNGMSARIWISKGR
jgi:multidrug resistance efflux pump